MRLFDRYRTDAVYNTRAIVQRTGVPADTLRAWERRYGVPNPPRTQGNQRLYSDRDVAIILWLRDQTQQGLSISQAVSMLNVDMPSDQPPSFDESIQSKMSTTAESVTGGVEAERLTTYRDRVVTALVAFDAEVADRIVEEVLTFVPVDDVCRYILATALTEIGNRWQRTEVGIATEHFASSFVMRKLSTLFNLSQPHMGRGPIVAATVAGEYHELGLLLTCLILSRRGFKIVYLGPNLPEDQLAAVVDDVDPPLVLLSSTTELSFPAMITTVKSIRDHGQRHPTTIPTSEVGYGGRIFIERPELREEVDGIYLGNNDQEVVRSIELLVSNNPMSWTR